MSKLTRQEIESLWVQAGGNPQNASTASAIAMAESGGDTDSKNDRNSNGTIDRGLWQINSVHGSLSTFDPLANARAAVSISSNGSNWKPWCVAWSDGACGGTFMGTGAPVLKWLGLGGSSTSQTVAGATLDTQGLTTSSLNPQTWVNAFLEPIGVWAYAMMMFALGAGMFGVGVWLLFRETQAGAAIERRVLQLGDLALPGRPLQAAGRAVPGRAEPAGAAPGGGAPAHEDRSASLPGRDMGDNLPAPERERRRQWDVRQGTSAARRRRERGAA